MMVVMPFMRLTISPMITVTLTLMVITVMVGAGGSWYQRQGKDCRQQGTEQIITHKSSYNF